MLPWALRYTIHCTAAPLTTAVKLTPMLSCGIIANLLFAIHFSYILSHTLAKPVLISPSISADQWISHLLPLRACSCYQPKYTFPFRHALFLFIYFLPFHCLPDRKSFYTSSCFILPVCLAYSHLSFYSAELPDGLEICSEPLSLSAHCYTPTENSHSPHMPLLARRAFSCSSSSPAVPPWWQYFLIWIVTSTWRGL